MKFKGRPIPLGFWAFHSIEQGFCKWILRVCTCLDLQLIRALAGIEHAAPHAWLWSSIAGPNSSVS